MKLLFDQNISFKVARKIQDVFPDSKHLSDLGLEGSSDINIWEYAKLHNLCIVTFDIDFIDISVLKGFPPKIIWIRTGNTPTVDLILHIQKNKPLIMEFLISSENAFLELR